MSGRQITKSSSSNKDPCETPESISNVDGYGPLFPYHNTVYGQNDNITRY